MNGVIDSRYIELLHFNNIEDVKAWMNDNPLRGFVDLKPDGNRYLLITLKSVEEIQKTMI